MISQLMNNVEFRVENLTVYQVKETVTNLLLLGIIN